MPDGRYRLSRLDVTVNDGVARLTEGGSIAGGTATLLDVVRWTVTTAGVALADAVTAATSTPADALALRAGRLRPGDPGDLVVTSSDLELVLVLRGGRVVTQAPGDGRAGT